MYINEQYHDLPLLETKEYRFISRDGQLISKQEQILKEHLIDVYLNDHLTMKLVCLPQYLTELVLGRLLTERIIDSISISNRFISANMENGQGLFKQNIKHFRKIPKTIFL